MMGLANKDITFLNFDDTYDSQSRLLQDYRHQWINLNDIQHTNLFCEEQSLRHIQQRLHQYVNTGIHFIGSGNYHYVSYLLLSELQSPFTLILLDHHTDMLKETSLMTCGSWVAEALANLDNLQQVIIVGPDESAREQLDPKLRNRISLYPNERITPERINAIMASIPSEHIYISLDKDVMDQTYAATNWDQGKMTMTGLLELLTNLVKDYNVSGFDICGEWPILGGEVFHPKTQKAVRKNEETNRGILQALLKTSS